MLELELLKFHGHADLLVLLGVHHTLVDQVTLVDLTDQVLGLRVDPASDLLLEERLHVLLGLLLFLTRGKIRALSFQLPHQVASWVTHVLALMLSIFTRCFRGIGVLFGLFLISFIAATFALRCCFCRHLVIKVPFACWVSEHLGRRPITSYIIRLCLVLILFAISTSLLDQAVLSNRGQSLFIFANSVSFRVVIDDEDIL